jgi:predicted nucleotidyltransferase
MDFVDIIERFLAERFPRAEVAIVAGSTARATRTSTSDIDLLLLGENLFDDDRESLAATYRFAGEVFEVFAYTEHGFTTWAERGLAQYRPVIVQMLRDGITVRGAAERERFRSVWEPRYVGGPVMDMAELDFRRYVITDVLDDFTDASDPLERRVLAALLFERVAELILLTNRRWIGSGKYLPRRLREFDADRARLLSAPLLADDHALFARRIADELDRAGGRLQEGFER